MSTPRPSRPSRPASLAKGFLDGIDVPPPRARRTPSAAPAHTPDVATTSDVATPAAVAAPAQPPAPRAGVKTSDRADMKIRRTAFLPPELVARVKLSTARTGMTYTVLTLTALAQCYGAGTLERVVDEYRARTIPAASATNELFPDLTAKPPARAKVQFPLHLTASQLATVDKLKDDIGVDRSFLIEAVLDAYLAQE